MKGGELLPGTTFQMFEKNYLDFDTDVISKINKKVLEKKKREGKKNKKGKEKKIKRKGTAKTKREKNKRRTAGTKKIRSNL